MPPKRYHSRFPTARIKKIMQLDDDVGKVASSVPLLISRAVEMFLQKMLTTSAECSGSKTSRTITPSHVKQVVTNDPQLLFLQDEVAKIPDASETPGESEDGRKKRGRKRTTDPGASKPVSGKGDLKEDLSEAKRKRKMPAKKVSAVSSREEEEEEEEEDKEDGLFIPLAMDPGEAGNSRTKHAVIVTSELPSSATLQPQSKPISSSNNLSSASMTIKAAILSSSNCDNSSDSCPVPMNVIKSHPPTSQVLQQARKT